MSKHNLTYTQLRHQEWIATRNHLAVWAVLIGALFMGFYIGGGSI